MLFQCRFFSSSSLQDALVHNYETMWRLAKRIPNYNFRQHALRRLREGCWEQAAQQPPRKVVSKAKAMEALKGWIASSNNQEALRLAVERSSEDLRQLERIQKIVGLYYEPEKDQLVIEKKYKF